MFERKNTEKFSEAASLKNVLFIIEIDAETLEDVWTLVPDVEAGPTPVDKLQLVIKQIDLDPSWHSANSNIHSTSTEDPLEIKSDSHSTSTEDPLEIKSDSHSASTKDPSEIKSDSHSASTKEPSEIKSDSHSASTKDPSEIKSDSHSTSTEDHSTIKSGTQPEEDQATSYAWSVKVILVAVVHNVVVVTKGKRVIYMKFSDKDNDMEELFKSSDVLTFGVQPVGEDTDHKKNRYLHLNALGFSLTFTNAYGAWPDAVKSDETIDDFDSD